MSFSEDDMVVITSLVSEEIDRARQTRWERIQRREERRRKMEQLKANPNLGTSSSQSITLDHSLEEENNSTHRFMDLDLYRAATKDDVDGFIVALERISNEKELPLLAIFEQVSPSGNTYLHIAASLNNFKNVLLIVDLAPWLLSTKNSKGDTPLHILARAGYENTVMRLVLNLECYEHSTFANGYKPESESATFPSWLMRAQNEEGNTILHEALIHGHESLAFDLLLVLVKDPEALYYLNKEGKSALYLATEACFFVCVNLLLDKIIEFESQFGKLKGKSPVHAAIMKRKIAVLAVILKKKPDWIHFQDEEGSTPLHCAAFMGYLEGVRYLLGKNVSTAIDRDKDGFFPIHMASAKGHVHLIQELLQHWPNVREMQNNKGQNILHVAATSGKLNVVNYILKTPELQSLVNDKDKDGNTPLHLATLHWHPKLVSALTWDKKVDLRLLNNDGLTALDIAECYIENSSSFRQRLTWIALKAAGVPRNPKANVEKQSFYQSELQSTDNYKVRVNTLLLVATLVATVTFAAGFTMPGSYNSSGEGQGMAIMLKHSIFLVFIFCNTIAMYCSIFVAVTLIWAQLGDIHLVLITLRTALPLLGVALATMSLAFLAGIYLVMSKLNWLANAIMIMGLVFLVALLSLYIFLWFPMSSSYRIMRYVSYFPFCLLVLVTGSEDDSDFEE